MLITDLLSDLSREELVDLLNCFHVNQMDVTRDNVEGWRRRNLDLVFSEIVNEIVEDLQKPPGGP